MKKIITPVSAADAAQQVYLLGTYNPDRTLFLLSIASVCYIPGPPESMVVGVVGSTQTKENIAREQAFSLNLCTVDMKDLADGAWLGYGLDGSRDNEIEYCNGSKLGVPILSAAPSNLECKVSQSILVGDTTIFICETRCIHVDSQIVSPYPGPDDSYRWYESIDAKKFTPLLYAFKYYTLSESIGQIGMKW